MVSDDDIHAIEKICGSVDNQAVMRRIREAITPRTLDLSDIGQRTRVRIGLARSL